MSVAWTLCTGCARSELIWNQLSIRQIQEHKTIAECEHLDRIEHCHTPLNLFCPGTDNIRHRHTAHGVGPSRGGYSRNQSGPIRRTSVRAHRISHRPGAGSNSISAVRRTHHSPPFKPAIHATCSGLGWLSLSAERISQPGVSVRTPGRRYRSAAGHPSRESACQKLWRAASGEVCPGRPPVAHIPRGSGRARAAA